MQLAPEIEQGIEHDAAVDVWGLGQLALKLLALSDDAEGHPLHTLAAHMV